MRKLATRRGSDGATEKCESQPVGDLRKERDGKRPAMGSDRILRLPELLQITDCRAPWHSSLPSESQRQ